jgi:hypothetical protein
MLLVSRIRYCTASVVVVAELERLCNSSQQKLLLLATVLPPSPGKTSNTAASTPGKQHDMHLRAMISIHADHGWH